MIWRGYNVPFRDVPGSGGRITVTKKKVSNI